MGARLLKDPATANCRIFIGHLQTDETNKVELEQHFAKYGTVIGSLINRGFGFVQFENEHSAQAAIKQEDGQIFKNRRIDVRPAKKDTHGGGGGNSSEGSEKAKQQGNQQFSQKNNSFQQRNNPFGSGSGGGGSGTGSNIGNVSNAQNFTPQKPNFSGGNQSNNSDASFDEKSNPPNNTSQSSQEQIYSDVNKSQNDGDFQQFDNSNSNSMNNVNAKRDNADQVDQLNSGSQNQNRGSANNQFSGNSQSCDNDSAPSGGSGGPGGNQNDITVSQNNQNRSSINQFNQGNQNRGNNQNRNPNSQSGSQNINQGQGQGSGGSRPRGNRGGKNKNKNRNENSGGGNNFRDRSPLNRGLRVGNDNKGGPRDWDHNMMPRNNFGRDSFNDNGRFEDRFKDMPMGGMNFDRPIDFPPSVSDKNDCEIIVVNKSLTEYAEAIEGRLKKMGLTVDLLFPNEEVPLSRVLGNIANRGCLYAVVVTSINMEHHSMTLNILHGLPQEHRNMPVEDALGLINRDFSNYKSGGRAVPFNTPFANDRHPDAIQVLLNMLADNHQLTVLQFDRVLKYLEIKREEQVQAELGDTKDLGPPTIAVNDPKQVELQSRILNILNSNKPTNTASISMPSPVPAPNPLPVPPAVWATASTTTTQSSTSTTTVTPSPLLNDPTVQKALDSLLQGNLLKNIGDSAQTTPSTPPQPLFAAFPDLDRF